MPAHLDVFQVSRAEVGAPIGIGGVVLQGISVVAPDAQVAVIPHMGRHRHVLQQVQDPAHGIGRQMGVTVCVIVIGVLEGIVPFLTIKAPPIA